MQGVCHIVVYWIKWKEVESLSPLGVRYKLVFRICSAAVFHLGAERNVCLVFRSGHQTSRNCAVWDKYGCELDRIKYRNKRLISENT